MELNEKEIVPLGFCTFRNTRKKFGIKVDDRRRHMYVIGKTGSGKSTLLENMAIEDILAGRGLAVVDPHGEFAEKMLDFIPEERLDDVIYFNPADLENPIAFNPLEQTRGVEFRHFIASGLMGVFKKIWPDVWSARMEYILNNTLLSLLEFPNSTILGVMRMFSEPEYRKTIVENLTDPVIKAFWQNEFARYTQRLETEAVAAIQNKVGQLVSNPLVRNILGQPRSTLDMRRVMDEGKILIVNLSKGKIGEDNSALLGAMIITRLQLAAMSRVDIPEEERKDFFLYVDEFQNFATESFATILSEARKYHLSLILAHQYIGQLVHDKNTRVRDAVFGNVGSIVSFRVGATDAEFLEKEFAPEFTENDLVNLPKYQIYIKLMIDGVASAPFSAETIPPSPRPPENYRDVIIKNSQTRYGTKREIVDARIASEWQETEHALKEKVSRKGEHRLSEALHEEPAAVRLEGRVNEPPHSSENLTTSHAPTGSHPRDFVHSSRQEYRQERFAKPPHQESRPQHVPHGEPIRPTGNEPSQVVPQRTPTMRPQEPLAVRPPEPPAVRPPEPPVVRHLEPPVVRHLEPPVVRHLEPRPSHPQQFQHPKREHPRQNVDVEALRRAIHESLQGQEEKKPINENEKEKSSENKAPSA